MNKRMRNGVMWMVLGGMSMLPVGYAESTGEGLADAQSTLDDIKTYIYNLGLNIGYETDPAKATQPSPPTNTLFTDDGTTQQLKSIAQYAFYSLFGSIPVNAFLPIDSKEDAAGEYIPFVPTDSDVKPVVPYVKPLNALANETFPDYKTIGSTPLSVSALLDQKEYQPDPVNQALLDSLVTPDKTFCMKNDGIEWKTECDLLYQTQVMSNAIGTLPATDTYFTYDYQAPFL
ncbi:MAG TPA: hypothetical protein DDY37_05600, partial [Legionella sp.]|nr:hypothetical protein [Legionella sp.]